MNARRIAILVAAASIAAAAAFVAYRAGMDRGMSMSAPSPATQAPAPGERRILYWHDPMVPGHRFDKPGKSPFMDMQLVPVYADEAQGPGVGVNPTVAQSLGVRTALVRRGSVTATVDAIGTVVQNERASVVVQSRTTGFVEKLAVRAVLDPVAKGQTLATVFVPEWAGALAEYVALARSNIDTAIVAAARERLRLLSIPDDIVQHSQREGVAQSRIALVAPMSGVVAELGVREGAMVAPGMPLFRIVDLSTVWIEASVPQQQAAELRVGMPAQARSEAFAGRTFAAKVDAILPQVDAQTRTVRARFEVRNPGTMLKPGMLVDVTLATFRGDDVLLVPAEAVIATGRRSVVIVAGDDNRFVPVDVVTGRSAGSDVEVRSGLAEGQRVVTSGQFLIDSEASLKSALSRLEGGASSGAGGTIPHRGVGRIESVGNEELVLSHEPIASLKWPAMTMGFVNPAGGLPAGLKTGDRVTFEFVERDGTYRLTRVEPTAPAKAKP